MQYTWLRSIKFKIFTMMVFPVVLLFILLLWNTKKTIHDFIIDNIHSSLRNYSQTLNLALSLHLASLESLTSLTPFLQELISIETGGITYLALLDENGEIIAKSDQSPSPLPVPDETIANVDQREILHIKQPILLGASSVGSLRYGISIVFIKESARQMVIRNLKLGAKMLGVILLVLTSLTLLTLVSLNRRLNRLMSTSAAIANGHYDITLEDQGRDEISILSEQMSRMAAAIRSRILALKENEREIHALNTDLETRNQENLAINAELLEAMQQLKRSQNKLVQSEKLAGLGSIVAAVAHELNSPIGNALTVSSSFNEKTREFRQEVEQGLRKSVLAQYLEDSEGACRLLLRNLHAAADLISSFKHVAVDQTSSRPREFMLDAVIRDVFATLLPLIKHRSLQVRTELAEGLKMDSYPGPLGQILNNLFNNAIMHGFDDEQPGEIVVTTERVGDDQVKLLFRDNGKGIPTEHHAKLFDPFFTTKLGKGGSGLGLHIVYNLVTGVLQGEISVHSVPGQGTEFEILLPLRPQYDKSSAIPLDIVE